MNIFRNLTQRAGQIGNNHTLITFISLLFTISLLTCILTGCGDSSNSSSALGDINYPNSNTVMREDELQYLPSNTYWTKNGTELVVEGGIYNLSSTCDVVSMEDAVIYLLDGNDTIVAEINVNESYTSKIPHNGGVIYNFTTTSVLGGSSLYKATELIPYLACSWEYVICEGKNCSYCGGNSSYTTGGGAGSSSNDDTCIICGGSGKCEICHGFGDCQYSYGTHPCVNGKLYMPTGTITCSSCNGTAKCYKCNGSGECTLCGGSGKR